MSLLYHPHPSDLTLAAIFYALGDPIRLQIVRNLAAEKELSCGAALQIIKLPKSTLSHHFRILRDSGLVHSRKSGTQNINRLRREDIEARFPGLLGTLLIAMQSDQEDLPRSSPAGSGQSQK